MLHWKFALVVQFWASMLCLTWTVILPATALGDCQAYWLQLKPGVYVRGCPYDLQSRWDETKLGDNDLIPKHTKGEFPARNDEYKRTATETGIYYTACYLIEKHAACSKHFFRLPPPSTAKDRSKRYGLFCMYTRTLERLEVADAPANAFPGLVMDWEDRKVAHNQCQLDYKFPAPMNAYWLTYYPPGMRHGDCPYTLQQAAVDGQNRPLNQTDTGSGSNCR